MKARKEVAAPKEGSAAQLVAGHVIPTETPAGDGPAGTATGTGNGDAEAMRNAIAAEAYSLWLARGCRQGHDLEDWLEAEQRVNGASQAEGDARTRLP